MAVYFIATTLIIGPHMPLTRWVNLTIIFLEIYSFYLCAWLFCRLVHMYTMWMPVPLKVRRFPILWNRSYSCELIFGNWTWFSARPVHALVLFSEHWVHWELYTFLNIMSLLNLWEFHIKHHNSTHLPVSPSPLLTAPMHPQKKI